MDKNPAPLQLLFGIILGFVSRPIIMGCFASKPAPVSAPSSDVIEKPAASRISVSAPPPSLAAQQPVIQVTRPGVSVGAKEKAELRVKTLRDRLQATVLASEKQMLDEGRLALQMSKEGRSATAKLLLMSRRHLKMRIEKCQVALTTAMEMIGSIEDADRNKRFIEAVESGNKVIEEIMSDLSPERVQKALHDKNEAKEYAEGMNRLFEEDAEGMSDDMALQELGEIEIEIARKEGEMIRNGQMKDEQQMQQKILQVPETPTEKPQQQVDRIAEENVLLPA